MFAHGEKIAGVILIRYPGNARTRLGEEIILLIDDHGIELKKYIEVVSKPQIRFKGKAQPDRESAVRHTFWRMSIYRRPVMHPSAIELARIPLRGVTQPLGLRWGFVTTSCRVGARPCQTKKNLSPY